MARRKPKKPRVRHPLRADRTVPADHAGNQWCVRCKHMGKPGDGRHSGDDEWPPDPYPAVPAEAAELEARILGESDQREGAA